MSCWREQHECGADSSEFQAYRHEQGRSSGFPPRRTESGWAIYLPGRLIAVLDLAGITRAALGKRQGRHKFARSARVAPPSRSSMISVRRPSSKDQGQTLQPRTALPSEHLHESVGCRASAVSLDRSSSWWSHIHLLRAA